MSRSPRRWLLCLAFFATVGCESALPPPDPEHADDLRVVMIVVDTMRADHLPFHGYERETAPFLSQLADHSIVFRHAHSPSSWTAPAMASVFTGVYPEQHGVLTGFRISRQLKLEVNRLPEDLSVLPELFQDAGYATLGVSDNINVSEELDFDRGFHRFRFFNYEGAQRVKEAALDWLDELRGRGRTFLYLHFMDPHMPYHAQEPWSSEFMRGEEKRVACYDSEIRYVDTQIAELFEKFGWDHNTLLIFSSDHGEEFGDHGADNHGHTLYSELIDVPLLLYCPRLWPEGKVIDGRVSLVDLVPTLAELCGLDAPSPSGGSSLVETIESGSAAPRPIYSHLLRRDLSSSDREEGLLRRALVVGDRKLIDSDPGEQELYDLRLDSEERRNLLDEWVEVAAEMNQQLDAFEAKLSRHATRLEEISLPAKDRQRIRTLGYVSGDSLR